MIWLLHRLASDFWPVDKASVAPNIVASSICFVAGWTLKGKQVVQGIHQKLDQHHSEQMAAHEATQNQISKGSSANQD